MKLIDGIQHENGTGFVGKDGFFWWVGEVEDNEDPMELGRVKVRILGYYTNFQGGTTADLPTDGLPWATVLQHTSQAGNDGQGESSGQLQPGAIVMGFFMDGEASQMPIVIGVMRIRKSNDTRGNGAFAFSDLTSAEGVAPNPSAIHPAEKNTVRPLRPLRQSISNNVAYPGQIYSEAGGDGSPRNIGGSTGIDGSTSNPIKPTNPVKPLPAANGVGGPWKTLEYKLSYLIEDLANSASTLVKIDSTQYLDLVTGKYVRQGDLTARLENYLTVIYAQVVSAMRSSVVNLAEDLKISNILRDSTGVPFATFNTIQQSVNTILTSLCALDSNIAIYRKATLGTVTAYVDGYLKGNSLSTKSEMVATSVNTIINDIMVNSSKITMGVGDLVKSVKTQVSSVDKNATKIIDEWEKGSGIYELSTDIFNTTETNLTGLMKLLVKFTNSNCERTTVGGGETIGWFPLFGVTRCTGTELDAINKLRGKSTTDNVDLLESMYEEADPNMTTARNYPNGSYEMFLGTPGRLGEVHKKVNGTTFTSISFNNAHLAEKQIRDKLRKEDRFVDLLPEDIESTVKEYIDDAVSRGGDTGNLVADHISYAGTLTQEVHGDDCKMVNHDYVRTIDGDYLLKITGNCHIEVGGGFFFSAEGAPVSVNKHGVVKGSLVQKHSLRFGSDVDMNVVGAAFELQGAECNLASASTKISGSLFENSSYHQTMSGVEISMTADNSIEMVTPHILQLINCEPTTTTKKVVGMRTIVVGGMETIINPKNAKDYEVNLDSKNAGYTLPITDKLYKLDVAGGTIDLIAGSEPFEVTTETTTTTDTTTTTTGEAGNFTGTSTSESTSTSTTGGGNLTLS